VTLFGHSAGGQDVGLLMLAPEARGLFHKAIELSLHGGAANARGWIAAEYGPGGDRFGPLPKVTR
jgi:carboxylesterase type B